AEPFVVFGKPPAYSFVTLSGKAYRCQGEGEGRRKVVPAWAGRHRPVVAVLGDADTGRAWAFARASKGGLTDPDVYFELAARVGARPFDRRKMEVAGVPEPL